MKREIKGMRDEQLVPGRKQKNERITSRYSWRGMVGEGIDLKRQRCKPGLEEIQILRLPSFFSFP